MNQFRQLEYSNGFDLGLSCRKSKSDLPDISQCVMPFRVGCLDAFYEKPNCNPWGNSDETL